MKIFIRLSLVIIAIILIVSAYYFLRPNANASRNVRVMQYIRNPQNYAAWSLPAGQACGDAPFINPTSGFIGFLWDDSFRPGHRHSGLDIFGGSGVGQTPVIAAYDGYLTREQDWKSTVIIRIPSDPLQPGRQIWTYYTHMASPDGESYISEDFPAGTTEAWVSAGTPLGLQGNYSGTPGQPTGVHLHFSIVKDDVEGRFLNELEIGNTLDPSPYLGMNLNAHNNRDEIPDCVLGWSVR
jgi:peptidoglycan LD-endopeptidase LytH